MNNDNWFYKYEIILISKELTHLFFIEKNTANILRENSEVLLINDIYKTNKYEFFFGNCGTYRSGHYFLCRVYLSKRCKLSAGFASIDTCLIKTSISFPTVVVTDCKLALINALATVFSLASHLLCV